MTRSLIAARDRTPSPGDTLESGRSAGAVKRYESGAPGIGHAHRPSFSGTGGGESVGPVDAMVLVRLPD